MLWGYFDGSVDEIRGYMTLAGIISSEVIWPEFEEAWKTVLNRHSLTEFHMTDAMAHPPRKKFTGWTDEAIKRVVNELANTIAQFAGNKNFLLKACTVRVEDYSKMKAENPYLRRPEGICVNFCCGTGLPPDPKNPDSQYQDVIFHFDRKEKYLRQIKSTWDKGKKYRTGWPSQVKDILHTSAQDAPALQAVDMIAWTANGFHKGDSRARFLFPIIPLSGGIFQLYDYDIIKREYGNDTPRTDPYAYKAHAKV